MKLLISASLGLIFVATPAAAIETCRFIEPIGRQAAVIAHTILGRVHPGYAHAAPVIRLKTRSAPIALHGAPVAGSPWHVVEESEHRLAMEQRHDGAVTAWLAA